MESESSKRSVFFAKYQGLKPPKPPPHIYIYI